MATLTLRPNAAGDLTQWYPQYPSGGFHWDKVDEDPADDMATYIIDASNANHVDLFNLPASGSPAGTINKITVYSRARRIGTAGSTYVYEATKTGGTLYIGNSHVLPTSGAWGNYATVWTNNPFTGLPWTWTEIDALQIGVMGNRSAAGANDVYCTQVYVVVDYTLALLAPGITAVTPLTESSLRVTIQDNSTIEDEFILERADAAGGPYSVVATIPTPNKTGSGYTFNNDNAGLLSQKTYYYRVRAHTSACQYSNYSNIASGTTPFYAPTTLQAFTLSASSTKTTWQNPSQVETAKLIERKTGIGGVWAQIASLAPNTLQYIDEGLDPETAYYYRVRNYKSDQTIYSTYSNEAGAITELYSNLRLNPFGTLIRLS